MLQSTLFFGRATPDGAVTDAEWGRFTTEVVTPRFPDGFTAFDAAGQWRDPATGKIGKEDTKVLLIAAPNSAATLRSLDEISAEYRTRFHQRSVGLATAPVCAAF